jgi:hypothetical protein
MQQQSCFGDIYVRIVKLTIKQLLTSIEEVEEREGGERGGGGTQAEHSMEEMINNIAPTYVKIGSLAYLPYVCPHATFCLL